MDTQEMKAYMKEYYQAHKEYYKAHAKAYRQAHKNKVNAYAKEYYQAHEEQCKAYRQAHKEERKEYGKKWREAHMEQCKAYQKSDLNSLGQTKCSIRLKSRRYLSKYGTKIPGYQIHHCCTYAEPYKFIYCTKEMHHLIHAYLRQHNIDADSNHYDQIKHLLDDSVFFYNI